MDTERFKDKITKIMGISQKELLELIEQEQQKSHTRYHDKVALMKTAINLYDQTHNSELFNEIKNYMTFIEEDICFDENLEIRTVKSYFCRPDNLHISFEDYGINTTIDLLECDCPTFLEKNSCNHIEIYKRTLFDPSFIPDSGDHFSYYNDIEPNTYTFRVLLETYPRWVLNYLFNRWLETSSKQELAKELKTNENNIKRLLDLLQSYHMKRKGDVWQSVSSQIRDKGSDVLWLPCEATDGGLTRFPSIPKNSSQFKFINLEDNRLVTLLESFGNFTAVEKLHLQRNYIKKLPESFGSLTELKELNIEYNQLKILPETFGNLIKLEDLKLNNNRLQILPDNFGDLTSLKFLNLSNNNLVALPGTFYNLQSLEILNLNNNKGLYISESFDKLKSLKKVSINDNGYISFPKSLCRLDNLDELSLASNKLKTVPECIGNMISLKSLNFNNNLIDYYPESLCKLNKLEFLRLGCVSYSIIPDFLVDFLIELETKGANLGIAPVFFDELKQRRT